MPIIVLMIPRRDDVTETALRAQITASMKSNSTPLTELPFVAGECQLEGYRNMILVENVNWEAAVEQEMSVEGRRTVHTPQMSAVKIKRKIDLATGNLTRWALLARVSQLPWELYFLRTLGGGDSFTGQQGVMHSLFMTVRLFSPLVTKYAFDIGDAEGEEDIEISPTAMEWIYQPTDPTQRVLGNRTIKFDLQAGSYT